MKDSGIPSREEHAGFIRRIWKVCIGMAIVVFLGTGSVVLGLFLAGHDSKKVVEISTSVFQVLVLSYGLAFFVPAFLTSLSKMSLGVEMSREGLEVGRKTAENLDALKDEFKGVLNDARDITKSMKDFVRQIEEKNPKAFVEFLDRLAKDGTVDKIAKSADIIARKFQRILDARQPVAAGDREKMISQIGGADATQDDDLR